jgi:hypothetical protein
LWGKFSLVQKAFTFGSSAHGFLGANQPKEMAANPKNLGCKNSTVPISQGIDPFRAGTARLVRALMLG